MRKIFLVLAVLFGVMALSGCGKRVAFTKAKFSPTNSLVYVYVSNNLGDGEDIDNPLFKIKINDKTYSQRVRMGEYLAFEMLSKPVIISAVRGDIEEQSVKLNLQKGRVYYLRVDPNLDNGAFSIKEIPASIASKEIASTGLAGSNAVDKTRVITAIVGDKSTKDDVIVTSKSKEDRIKEAYQMKKDGLIDDAEYKKLKLDILSK